MIVIILHSSMKFNNKIIYKNKVKYNNLITIIIFK